jgi:hypothetical protein
MASVRILRETLCSDLGVEVPREKWAELLLARRDFCQQVVPQDCRQLLFFIQDGAANDWLGLGGREQYIRDGLKLEPKMVEWALEGLTATRPDVAVKFDDAVTLGLRVNGGDRKSVTFQEAQQLMQHGGDRKNQSDNITLKRGTQSAYIRARLERDAADTEHPEKQTIAVRLLPRVQSGEISAHAAAIEAGFRQRLVQVSPTVAGFARAIRKHLGEADQSELKEQLWPKG